LSPLENKRGGRKTTYLVVDSGNKSYLRKKEMKYKK
jgi:hypothetical protein